MNMDPEAKLSSDKEKGFTMGTLFSIQRADLSTGDQ
jgi:hypothetical protein